MLTGSCGGLVIGGCWPHFCSACPHNWPVSIAIACLGKRGHHPGGYAKGPKTAGPLPDISKAARPLGSSAHGNYDADNSEMLFKFMATEGLLNWYSSSGLSTPFLAPFSQLPSKESYLLHFFYPVKNDTFQPIHFSC